jgi:hypothetical protein
VIEILIMLVSLTGDPVQPIPGVSATPDGRAYCHGLTIDVSRMMALWRTEYPNIRPGGLTVKGKIVEIQMTPSLTLVCADNRSSKP